jgi:hypothetical protein
MIKYLFFFLINLPIILWADNQQQAFAFWPLGKKADENVFIAKEYNAKFDMRNKSWQLAGYFTAAKQDKTSLAGTRCNKSGYSGWDLTLLHGKLRFFACANNKESVTFSSTRRFDDGKEHSFKLTWNSKANDGDGEITLNVDDKYNYSSPGIGDLGENSGRIFTIGTQYGKEGACLRWKGQLRNFKFSSYAAKSNASITAADLDSEMKAPVVKGSNTAWIDIGKSSLIKGKGWNNKEFPYQRLPMQWKDKVRKPVWTLSKHSAGVYLHFKISGSNFINIRWKLNQNVFFAHMTPVGINGVDLYVKLNGVWRFVNIGRPTRNGKRQNANLASGLHGKKMEFMLYLPLYTSVESVQLGVAPGAKFEEVKDKKAPLVFYGTSITHGCSASRPGMAYPAIIGRHLDMPTINLGFSGNGTMDPEFAALLAEIEASAYVIDCLPNMMRMSPAEIIKRTHYLVVELRKRRPNTPIILLEDRPYGSADLSGKVRTQPGWIPMRKVYKQLLNEGVKKLYLVRGEKIIGTDTDATIDSSHLTDLGMMRMSKFVEPTLREAIGWKK